MCTTLSRDTLMPTLFSLPLEAETFLLHSAFDHLSSQNPDNAPNTNTNTTTTTTTTTTIKVSKKKTEMK
jgi:hypothetical protein